MTRAFRRDDATSTGSTANESSGLDTLLIGIDAGCLPVFERLFEDDRIPAIEGLCSAGVAAPLESQIPPWTPSAWPSIYTGVNPGKHGVVGFVGYDGYDWHVTSNDDVHEHPLWTLLDRHDRSSVVVNAPVTHPPDEFDGAVIPDSSAPRIRRAIPTGSSRRSATRLRVSRLSELHA